MATRPLSDRTKAERAAQRAYLRWMFGPPDRQPDLERRARQHLEVVAHWDGDDEGNECTCESCWPWGDWAG